MFTPPFTSWKVLAALFVLVFAIGCSGSDNVMLPAEDPNPAGDLNIREVNSPAGKAMLGMYSLQFDEENLELKVVRNRTVNLHYNGTAYVDPPSCGGTGCLTVNLEKWDPLSRELTGWATIENPTGLTFRDVRVMFENLGNRRLLTVNGYTPDWATGGVLNPFMVFGYDTNYILGPSPASITEYFAMKWPKGSSIFLDLIVEGCWPGYCPEPYSISAPQQDTVEPGAWGDIFCYVYDHQDNVAMVRVDTSEITGDWTELIPAADNRWEASINPLAGVEPGNYVCWIEATSEDPSSQSFELMYNKMTIKVGYDAFTFVGFFPTYVPQGYSLDIGVIGDAFGTGNDSRIVMAGNDPEYGGACDALDLYAAHYFGKAMYKSLGALDPYDSDLLPAPPTRIDVCNNGAVIWGNSNTTDIYYPYGAGIGIVNAAIVCSLPSNLDFEYYGYDTHAHYFPTESTAEDYYTLDVCDDFDYYQYALVKDVDTFADIIFMGFEGPPGGDYSDHDVVYYASFASYPYFGTGPGKINECKGMDCFGGADGGIDLFIAEGSPENRIEEFTISDTEAGFGNDLILPNNGWDITMGEPIDLELMGVMSEAPFNSGYPTLCVLIALPGGGGDVLFYDTQTDAFIGALSGMGHNLPDPPVPGTPLYMETDDYHYEIHVMQTDGDVNIYKWS